jgi:hypothetical protein
MALRSDSDWHIVSIIPYLGRFKYHTDLLTHAGLARMRSTRKE